MALEVNPGHIDVNGSSMLEKQAQSQKKKKDKKKKRIQDRGPQLVGLTSKCMNLIIRFFFC